MRAFVISILLLCVPGCTEERTLLGDLRVCFAAEDLPRAERQNGSGFDMDVARAVANELSRRFVPVWMPAPDRTEIEVSDVSYTLLLRGACDLQMSVAGGDLVEKQGAIALSVPYYGAAFELIPEGANPDLANWDGRKIAVRANSLAHIVVDRFGLPWTMKRDTEELLHAVTSGEVEAALVWGPDLATSRTTPDPSFEPLSVLKWNQHLAVAASNRQLLGDVDGVLAQDNVQRKIMELLAHHHIPVHAPFAQTFLPSDLEKLK